MQKLHLSMNISFSGIGCQDRGFINSKVIIPEVLSVTEIDRHAILSYAAIHKGLTPELVANYKDYPSEAEMVRELIDKNIGYNPKTGASFKWDRIKKNREYIIKSNWLASHLINNLGDIRRIESLPEADLWTVSFPCQDISCAGEMKGFQKNSGTRSSLLWEQIRLLRKAIEDGTQPKFLLFENVKNIVGSKFKADFLDFLDVLDELGYNAQYRIMNAKDFGIPQSRERVFVVCCRKDIDFGGFAFPQPFKCDVKLEGILDPKMGKGISLNQDRLKEITAMLKAGNWHSENDGKACKDKEEPAGTADKGTASNKKKRYQASGLTASMCFKLMGMTDEDVYRCRRMGISENQLCKQAGNGIVTDCVQVIAEHLYKALIDPSFVCTDEKRNGAGWKVTPVFLLNLEKKPA